MECLFITKYPPLEGGTSSRAYWLIRGLAESGIKINVLTNSWDSEKKDRFEISQNDLDEYKPKNVEVFSTTFLDDIHFIPYSNPYIPKIVNLGLEILNEKNIDIIDSWYFIPYVVSGFFLKMLSKKPLIVRHAGSDLVRMYDNQYLSSLLRVIMNKSNTIFSSHPKIEDYAKNRKKIIRIGQFGVNQKYFRPNIKKIEISGVNFDLPKILYIGKAREKRGIYRFIDSFSKIKKNKYECIICTSKNDFCNILTYSKKRNVKVSLIDYLPPWRIPNLFNSVDFVVFPEFGYSVPERTPIIPFEAMSCETACILSIDVYKKPPYSDLKSNEDVLIVNNSVQLNKTVKDIIENKKHAKDFGKKCFNWAKKINQYKQLIDVNREVYKDLIQ